MSQRNKFLLAGVASACLLLAGWEICRHPQKDFAKSSAPPPTPSGATTYRSQTENLPVNNNQIVIPANVNSGSGNDQRLVLALDEFALKNAKGALTITKLDPPATPETLGKRLAEFSGKGQPMPLAYPENETRRERNRRLVTERLRVQVPRDQADALAAKFQMTVDERPDYTADWVILKAADPLAALALIANVRAASGVTDADVLLGRRFSLKTLPNDPLISQQWHLKQSGGSVAGTDINVENAWQYGLTTGVKGTGIRIGIIDDGLQVTHPDLSPNVDLANSHDWVGNDSDPSPEGDDDHGTACAGVAGARGNNGIGVSGVAPEATLVGERLLPSSGFPTDAQEASAFSWKNDIIQVKSNSWGPYDGGDSLDAPEPLALAAFADAATNGRGGKGTVFVWAGGNGRANSDNSNYDGYANSIYTIGVGAIDSLGRQSWYSESGANLLIVAPSSGLSDALGIVTTDRTGAAGYNTGSTSGELGDPAYTNDFGGTSSATPVISGVVALMLQRNPNLGWRDVQEILFRSAAQIAPTDSGWKTNGAGFKFNHKFGGGLVNAAAAVDMAATWTNLRPFTSISKTDTNNVPIAEGVTAGISKVFNFTQANHRVEKVTVKLSASHSYRGDLVIKLTSPSGMVSQLAEVHSDPTVNYTNWTFSSVQNWGEIAGGNWTVNVRDAGTGNTVGGVLGAVTLTLYGSTVTPSVQIISPTAGQILSTGTLVTVQATATDLVANGGTGVVSKVELFVDNVSVGIDTSPPYTFTFLPANGIHTLIAKATNSAGATNPSPAVLVTVANQAPVFTSAALSATSQAYTDSALSVSNVVASDPEGLSLTYSYLWQSSTDGINFANSTYTGANLPVTDAFAGKSWRCVITASDGANTTSYSTAAVNLLLRPATNAKRSATYSYTSGLVLNGVMQTVTRQAIINEFSQGSETGGAREWVELLVLKSGSIAGYQIKDSSTAAITFKNVAPWTNVPAGTLIVVYNGSSRDSVLPADNYTTTTGKIVVGSNNTTYLAATGWIALANAGDSVSLTNGTTTLHSVSYGNNASGNPVLDIVPDGREAFYASSGDADANVLINWSTGPATVGNATPGVGNNADNQSFIDRLRTNTLTENPVYRIGAGADIPAGLTLNPATGVLAGTISATATVGNHAIIIERYNSLGNVVSQTYNLRIYPVNYADWIAGYTVSNAAATADPDADGLPNLVEYVLDGDPKVAQSPASAAVSYSATANSISLIYRQSKVVTDATLAAEWSTTISAGAVWQTTGITTTTVSEDAASKLLKASLPISASDPKRFLRLRATQNP